MPGSKLTLRMIVLLGRSNRIKKDGYHRPDSQEEEPETDSYVFDLWRMHSQEKQKGNEGSRTGQGRKPGKGVGLSGDYSQILQAAQWPELHRELFLLEMRGLGFVPLVSQSLSIGCPRSS